MSIVYGDAIGTDRLSDTLRHMTLTFYLLDQESIPAHRAPQSSCEPNFITLCLIVFFLLITQKNMYSYIQCYIITNRRPVYKHPTLWAWIILQPLHVHCAIYKYDVNLSIL